MADKEQRSLDPAELTQNSLGGDLKKRKKKIISISIMALTVIALVVVAIIIGSNIHKENQEGKASEQTQQEKEEELAAAYSAAEALADSDPARAAIAFGKLGDYKDARARSFALWDKVAVRKTIAAGEYHTVALKSDGTVVAVGDNTYGQCNVSGWTDIVAIDASNNTTVGLKADGTVVATGDDPGGYDYNDYRKWTNIVAISMDGGLVGLTSAGTVVDLWGNTYPSDVVSIAAQDISGCLCLQADGTAVSIQSSETDAVCSDITAVFSGGFGAFALKENGTLSMVHSNMGVDGFLVSDFDDVKEIAASLIDAVILKNDGTVIYSDGFGSSRYELGWHDIVAVSISAYHIVGLKADGTVVAMSTLGDNEYGECNVSGWIDIKVPGK